MTGEVRTGSGGQPSESPHPDLAYLTIAEASDLLERGELSSTELTRVLLDRIQRIDASLHCYATVMTEQALAASRRADAEIAGGHRRGPLHGIPVAVKDLCFTRGVRTMGGSAVLADHVPTYDATVVTRLEAAGAVILGKLQLTEGAMSRYHPSFHAVVNPWNPGLWPGASSSGSGASVAAGLAFATLGSDTGGSIRFPAAACGVVGLKPTWGRVSRYGVLALAESLDHVGPMARCTADAALIFQTIAGHDSRDPTSLPDPAPAMTGELERGIQGARIGMDEEDLERYADPEVAAGIRASLEVLKSCGGEIVPVKMPDAGECLSAWPTLCSAEAVAAHRNTYPSRRGDYGPWFRSWLDLGAGITGAEYARASYLRAALNGRMREVMARIDVLACPSMPGLPFAVTQEKLYGPMEGAFDPTHQRYTVPFDFNGAPTLSLPCGLSRTGVPLSLQLAGQPLGESLLCRVGYAFERAAGWHRLRPPSAISGGSV